MKSIKSVILIIFLILASFTMMLSSVRAATISTSVSSYTLSANTIYPGEFFTIFGRIQPNPPAGGYNNIYVCFSKSADIYPVGPLDATDNSGGFSYTTSMYPASVFHNPGVYSVWFYHNQETIGSSTYTYCESAKATVTVLPPDFNISTSPTTRTTNQGGSAQYAISLNSLGGFNSPVSLSVTGLPTGATASFSPPVVIPTGTSTLTITTSSSTQTTNYQLTIKGTSATPEKTATVQLVVFPTLSVSVSPPGSSTLNVGQSKAFTATPSGGSGTYTSYQWYVNGVAQSGQTASTFSFSATSAGSYSITASVTDSSGYTSAASTAAVVTVDVASTLDHFEFGTIGSQTAGTAFSITITAKDQNNAVLATYAGSNTITYSAGTITPTVTGAFTAGVWTGSVTLSSSASGASISTSGGGKSGTSNAFNVNPASATLDHFEFDTVGSQSVNSAFNIKITAKDQYNAVLTSYTGTNTLSVSSGTINPESTSAFVAGVWTGTVTLSQPISGISIATSGGGKSGISNTFSVIDNSPNLTIYVVAGILISVVVVVGVVAFVKMKKHPLPPPPPPPP